MPNSFHSDSGLWGSNIKFYKPGTSADCFKASETIASAGGTGMAFVFSRQ